MKKYAAITGASAGIGRETARRFASEGRNAILIARRRDRLEDLKKELNEKYPDVDVAIAVCDLSNIEETYRLYEDLQYFSINIFVNCAGVGMSNTILEQDIHTAIQMINLNVESLTILSNLYAKDHFNDPDATLINVTSYVGYSVSNHVPTYSATKFYVSSFTEALYWEIENMQGRMKVRLLAPCATATEFSAVSSGEKIDKEIEHKKIDGNTTEEMAEFLEELMNSDKCVGYADPEEYKFHLCDPRMPHSFTKIDNPNLLLQDIELKDIQWRR